MFTGGRPVHGLYGSRADDDPKDVTVRTGGRRLDRDRVGYPRVTGTEALVVRRGNRILIVFTLALIPS